MRKTNWLARILRMHSLAACAMLASASVTFANGNGGYNTHEPPQVVGDSSNTNGEWCVDLILTIGEQQGRRAGDLNGQKLGYSIPGVLDGIGAYQVDHQFVRVVVNHEFGNTVGAPYMLGNGTTLTGGGSALSTSIATRASPSPAASRTTRYTIETARLSPVHATSSSVVWPVFAPAPSTRPSSLATGSASRRGSTSLVKRTPRPWRIVLGIDLDNGELWACPDLGRGAWENATIVDSGSDEVVAILLADDTAPRPMYLYVGVKVPGGTFLEQNGLSGGQIFAWKSDSGDLDPSTFGGNGSTRSGTWVPLTNTGMGAGYVDGYATNTELLAQATGAVHSCFRVPRTSPPIRRIAHRQSSPRPVAATCLAGRIRGARFTCSTMRWPSTWMARSTR